MCATSAPNAAPDKEQLLQQSLVFQALDQTSRQRLAKAAHLREFAAGDVIFNVGDPGNSMMAIARGQVRISIITPTARDMVLADLQAGDAFGEIALLDGGARSATARATSPCTLVVLERRALLAALRDTPDLAIRLVELLCTRLRRSDERMVELGFLQLPSRLARTLLRLSAARDGSPSTRLSQSQSEIANMIGSSRENVNRCLRKWQKSGLVDLNEGWLILSDRAGLEQLADDES